MHPKLKLNVEMSRVRQPKSALVDNNAFVMETQEPPQDESCGRMEMLHLHSEVNVETPSSGGQPDSFTDDIDQGSVGDEMQLKSGSS